MGVFRNSANTRLFLHFRLANQVFTHFYWHFKKTKREITTDNKKTVDSDLMRDIMHAVPTNERKTQ